MNSIDIHTHGIGGFDTRDATVGGILRIAEIQGASEVSEILLSIYPGPIETMRQQMELVRKAMEEQRRRHPSPVTRHGFTPARILGVHLEGPFLNPTQCGALDPIHFTHAEEHIFRELVDGFEGLVKMITVAPELEGAPALIRKMTQLGIIASMGHSDATYAEAEAGFSAGARGITHLFNGMRAFHHREPGLAGFGLFNEEIYVEVLADPFHLHIRTLEHIFRTKKPGRIVLVSDSVKETKTDGDGKVADASGRLQGGSMAVAQSAQRLIELGFQESAVMEAITVNPRAYLLLKP